MSINIFIEKIHQNQPVSFAETITVISENYHYQPTEFSNGLGEHTLTNAAGSNEGSCKIFFFAGLHQLNQQQTLSLFGDYYRKEVLEHPNGTDHQNIRNFMRFGWDGIRYQGTALTVKENL